MEEHGKMKEAKKSDRKIVKEARGDSKRGKRGKRLIGSGGGS